MNTNGLETKTFYEVLGVPPDASTEQIREVYREIARVYHPDSNFYNEIVPEKASSDQVQIFKIITAAYNTLTDPAKRAEYDESIGPLLALKKKVKDWEQETEVFTPSRPLDPPGSAKSRPRRATATFGRREFFDQSEPLVEAPQSRPKVDRLMLAIIGMGVIGGMLAGAVTYYLMSR